MFCWEHSDTSDHDCQNHTSTSSTPTESKEPTPHSTETPSNTSTSSSGSGGRLVAGAILVLAGVILSVTVVGAIVGVPLAILGFGVMFPRFVGAMVLLAVLAVVFLAAVTL